MITGAVGFVSFLGILHSWLAERRRIEEGKAQQQLAALEALLEALGETETHLETLRRGEAELEGNPTLTRLWMRAAGRFEPVAPEISRRCRFKGDYWTQPGSWTGQQIDTANIRIQDMSKQARKMLEHGQHASQ